MELKVFLADLVAGLSLLDLVVALDVRTEAFTVKGRMHLKEGGFKEDNRAQRIYRRFRPG